MFKNKLRNRMRKKKKNIFSVLCREMEKNVDTQQLEEYMKESWRNSVGLLYCSK